MVNPDYQGKGLGKMIMKEIDFYLKQNTDKNAYVCLIANKPVINSIFSLDLNLWEITNKIVNRVIIKEIEYSMI